MWRRRSAASQLVWVLACPGPPRRYRRTLELWLSVVSQGQTIGESNALSLLRRFNISLQHWAPEASGRQDSGTVPASCQLVPGLTLEAERNMHTSGRVVG